MSSDYNLSKPPILNFAFGDHRINTRANKMVNTMAIKCGKSFSQVFNSEADLKGAYRFLDNNLVAPDKILAPHMAETIVRCKRENLVAVIQDSSDLDFDYLTNIEGFERLHINVEKGFRIHPLLVVNDHGTPLGILGALNYTRSTKQQDSKNRNSLYIEEKESYRWLIGFRKACELKKQLPNTTVVSIADREGDIYECIAEAQDASIGSQAHILVRSNHNRCLEEADPIIDKLEKKLIRSRVVYEAELTLNRYRSNERVANLAIRATTVTIKAPATCLKKTLPSVQINAVLVSEIEPPKGVKPLQWLLLTTLPIDEQEQIMAVVALYAKRWMIEIYFKVLKSGCKIDSPRHQQRYRIENFIAIAMIVAWRVMLQTYLPREYPNVPCTILFTEIEWKLAYHVAFDGRRSMPQNTPTLKEAVMFIAMLGGYQRRKQPPGIQTIWQGTVRLMDLVKGYKMAQQVSVSQIF
jgi:hypothetical protein